MLAAEGRSVNRLEPELLRGHVKSIGIASAFAMLTILGPTLGCNWVSLTSEGENVRVLQASAVTDCQKVGKVSSKTSDRILFFANLPVSSCEDEDSIRSLGRDFPDFLTIRDRVCLENADILTFTSKRNPVAAKRGPQDGKHGECAGDFDWFHVASQTLRFKLTNICAPPPARQHIAAGSETPVTHEY